MHLTQKLRSIFDATLCLTYPQPCSLCGSSVELRSLGVACEKCWSEVKLFSPADRVCWKCGRPLVRNLNLSDTEINCHECDTQAFDAARSCGVYEGALRQNVLQLKRIPYLPSRLLSLLAEVAARPPLKESTRIIPIPLHPFREKKRGFNQASVMARSLTKLLKTPMDDVSLKRVRHSELYRAGLDYKSRANTVADAFAVRQPRLVRNESIMLIDDVFTTGATASSCAKVLLEAGAKSVYVLTLARPGH